MALSWNIRTMGFKLGIGIFLAVFVYMCSVEQAEGEKETPSILDLPAQGLYFGFVTNNSSHFTEVKIWSMKENRQVYRNIILPPPKSSEENRKELFEYWKKYAGVNRPPNVFAIWLRLGTYRVSIRWRDDLENVGATGTWKRYLWDLDQTYVKTSNGPFNIEIEDDK